MFAEERLRQLGMSDPSSRSYKAGDLSDPEQQLRYHLQQLEASQASSGRKPSNMVRVINSFNIQLNYLNYLLQLQYKEYLRGPESGLILPTENHLESTS